MYVKQKQEGGNEMRMFGKMMMCGVAALMTLSFVAGCRSVHGNKKITDTKITDQIVVNKTTQAEVQNLLGTPMKKTPWGKDSEGEMWMYSYVASQSRATSWIPYVGSVAGGSDTEQHNLDLYFNKDGVVVKKLGGASGGSGGGIQDMNK